MRRLYLITTLLLGGCLTEKNIDPGNPDTFVKYYNGGFNDGAEDIKQTDDGGFILLSTTEIRTSEVEAPRFKIKLIKTDEFGTPQWTKVYPEYDPDPEATDPIDDYSFKGRSIQIIRDGSGSDNGFVIVGDSLQKGDGQQYFLRIMVTDNQGNVSRARNFKPVFKSIDDAPEEIDGGVNGYAVAINAQGNYVVLGSSFNPRLTKNMFLAELSPNLDSLWSRTYGAGTAVLANKLFVDTQSSLFWSGTVVAEGLTTTTNSDIRLVKTPPNSENTEFDLGIGDPIAEETGRDMCQYGFGFAVIGTTNQTTNGDQDIIFKRLTQDGAELTSQIFGFPNQSENGLSICQARDGGLILLGSVDSNTNLGRGGLDYYLIKINAFGDKEWEQIFGSKNDDIGKSVLSLADGSYILYGTTEWGGLKTLTLIKTNKLGQIE